FVGRGAVSLAEDAAHRRPDERSQGCQQALLLVLEVGVEGTARDAGELEQVLDPGRLVTLLRDHRDERCEEPLTLVASDLVGGQPPARLELAVAQRVGVPPRRPDHRTRTITGCLATWMDA